MPTIHLTTVIHAPLERVFDLSRSITLHKRSMEHTREVAVKGRTSGLIDYNETVTWQAKHLGRVREMTVKITAMQPWHFFRDEMTKGPFREFSHEHHFKEIGNGTVAIDVLNYSIPYGKLGEWFNQLFLVRYMTNLLRLRNQTIKDFAESEKWRVVLD
ncbi:cell division protein [Chitinophaga parva]|uniref:Cell division protein n=1 Tax=Chitinophaga parva TaxID=2169414 RepID=A0A2T7BLI0_9BACT|nr:SRPBCC family protein [Chitinophaga parva]PUZ28516.1 cell division protein [Chitinophaga parva]